MRVSLLQNVVGAQGDIITRPIHGRLVVGIGRKALSRARAWRRRLAEHGEGDASWDWTRFLREFSRAQEAGLGRFRSYSLWALQDLQGLMILDVAGFERRTRAANLPQVYVEYLSVAPHNRESIVRPRTLIGCGSRLLNAARNESLRLDRKGRLGLHSLPGAIAFYASQGFRDLGPDPREAGYHYMEYSGKL